MYFWEIILDWMVAPLSAALPKGRESVIFTQVGEAFFTAIKVAFFSGFIFASYSFSTFFKPHKH